MSLSKRTQHRVCACAECGVAVGDLGEFMLIDGGAIVAQDALDGCDHTVAFFALVDHGQILELYIAIRQTLDVVAPDKRFHECP